MSDYKDRGIMKWAPFDALTGQRDILEELLYNINKKEKTTLSDDENNEINSALLDAFNNKKTISIQYYSDGYSYTTFGIIKKIDTINKVIILNTDEKVLIDDILDARLTR